MRHKTPKLLEDIRDATSFILESTRGKTRDDYRNARLLRQAVERNFEIIGEAVKRLDRLDPDTSARIGHCSHIIAFRNMLIHGYDLIDDAQVWNVIERQLPTLLNDVESLLREEEKT